MCLLFAEFVIWCRVCNTLSALSGAQCSTVCIISYTITMSFFHICERVSARARTEEMKGTNHRTSNVLVHTFTSSADLASHYDLRQSRCGATPVHPVQFEVCARTRAPVRLAITGDYCNNYQVRQLTVTSRGYDFDSELCVRLYANGKANKCERQAHTQEPQISVLSIIWCQCWFEGE